MNPLTVPLPAQAKAILAAAELDDDSGYRGTHRRPDTTVAGLPADEDRP